MAWQRPIFWHKYLRALLSTYVYKSVDAFWMGFTLTNFFHFVSLAKCPFCNIYLESINNTNQKYLKIYFLILFLKQILNAFLKRYFFKVKIKLWPNVSIKMCVNTLKHPEDDYYCETDWPYLENPETTSEFERIIQDHKLMTICKNHLKKVN